MPRSDQDLETREVRVDDPSLSPELNARLTDELRKAVGAKRVQVPRDTPHREHELRGRGAGFGALLGRNRLLLAVTAAMAIVVGAIIALASAQWWVLFIPVGVHAIATFIVGFMVIQMSTQPEAPDPTVTAALDDAGVPAPERVFNELVEEFSGETEAGGATEVLTTGHEEDSALAGTEPARAAAQQRTAFTPAEEPTEPAAGGVVMGIQWFIIVGMMVASLVIAIGAGGLAWLLPAIMWPFCAGWIGYQVIARRHADHAAEHPAGDRAHQLRRAALVTAGGLVAIELVTVVVYVLGTAGR